MRLYDLDVDESTAFILQAPQFRLVSFKICNDVTCDKKVRNRIRFLLNKHLKYLIL